MEGESKEVQRARAACRRYIEAASPGRVMLILEVLRGMFGEEQK